MEETISVRIPKHGLIDIDRISKFENATKSAVMREIVDLGIKEKMIALALQRFQKNKISAWKAARFANIPLTEFLDIIKKEGLEFHYTEEELLEDFKSAQ